MILLDIIFAAYAIFSQFVLQEEKLRKHAETRIFYDGVVGAASQWWSLRGIATAQDDIRMLKRFSGRASLIGLALFVVGTIMGWRWLLTVGNIQAVLFGISWFSLDWVFNHKKTLKETLGFYAFPLGVLLLILIWDNPPWGGGHFATAMREPLMSVGISFSDPTWVVPASFGIVSVILVAIYVMAWIPMAVIAGFLVGGLRLAGAVAKRAPSERVKKWLYIIAVLNYGILPLYALWRKYA